MKAFSKKVLRTMLLLCLVAAPLIFLAAEPPLAVYYQGRISGAALCGAAFLFLALCYAIYRWAKSRIAFSAACLVMYAFPAAVILITCFAPPGPNSVTDFWRFLVLFLWGAAAVSFYCGAGERLIWPGLFGLVLVLSSLYAVELALRAVPVDVFSKQILSVPSFADMTQLPPPRKEPVRAPGRICADSARTPVRILVVGGAASAGEPLLAPSLSYVFHLQRLLDERRPGECFEVLSAAVAGAGAVDVLHQMQQQPSPPADIVLVESGRENLEQRALNGSSAILSDREMHQRRMFFERLSRVPGYLTWRRTRSFAVLRYYLLALRDGIAKTISGPALKTKYRVSSADFGWALREAARYGARNDLRIVFVDVFSSGQPKGRSLARPDDHAAALVRAAKAYDIPLVSLETNSTPAQKREMFCGPHLLNAAGHRFLAQQLYDVFFAPQTASYWTALWQRKNIDPARKPLGKEIRLALGALDTAQSEIRIRATAPFLTVEKALLAARVDYGALHILGVIGKDEQVFTASREMLGVLRPIGEI
ncbi:MAG TPA: hypothetical protein PLP17_10035, partial [Oligoflexia bacterium]|nr:hypothetical protein [Oligoflexia bacterium]